MVDTLKQRWGSRICSWVPLRLWHRLLGVELVLPYWHVVSNEDLPHISGLYRYRAVREFKADLEFFLRYYTPVSLQDVLNHLTGDGALPKRCFLPTFDDGFREVHQVIAPLLRTLGVPAVFFVITSVVDNHELCYPQKKSLLIRALATGPSSAVTRELARRLKEAAVIGSDLPSQLRSIHSRQRGVLDALGPLLGCDFTAYAAAQQPYLTSAQVEALLRDGFSIGAHSVDHPLYPELSLAEQLSQTQDSLEWLAQRFCFPCDSFAFPYQDTEVTPEFFHAAFADGRLKISFGSGGLMPHFFPRNLPRFTMERTELPAGAILARQFGRTLLREPFGAFRGNAAALASPPHTRS